jgi:hypothetical protein
LGLPSEKSLGKPFLLLLLALFLISMVAMMLHQKLHSAMTSLCAQVAGCYRRPKEIGTSHLAGQKRPTSLWYGLEELLGLLVLQCSKFPGSQQALGWQQQRRPPSLPLPAACLLGVACLPPPLRAQSMF